MDSQHLEKVVYDFYKEVYSSSMRETISFLSFRNNIFNHPVVTPNFFTSRFPSSNDLSSHPPWVNCFEDPQKEKLLSTVGFTSKLSCRYIYYFAPRPIPQSALSLRSLDDASMDLQEDFDRLTSENSPGLSLELLKKLRQVFDHSQAIQQRIAAFDSTGRMVAGITFLEGRSSTLLLNAWVIPPERRLGHMNFLVNSILEKSFSAGTKCVFAWTFNSTIFGKADAERTLQIYERPLPKSVTTGFQS